MKRTYILLLLLLIGAPLLAQQDAQFTHYSFNTLLVNSGYAGSRDAITVNGLHRSQWINIPGAPQTQTFSIHAPIRGEKIGLGMTLLRDQIGPTNTTGATVDFAYKIKVGRQSKLAFGIKGDLRSRSNNLNSEVVTTENGDESFMADNQTSLLPNFGLGLYYSNPKYYIGLSVPRLLENDLNSGTSTNLNAKEQRHYFLIAGAILNINSRKNIKFRPSTLLKVTTAAPIELDLTALFYFKDKYWLGPTLRTTDAVGILTGLNLSNQFSIGYSFDWSYANTTGVYNAGSHELMMTYDFVYKNKGNILSPRYF